jgi:CHRD domain
VRNKLAPLVVLSVTALILSAVAAGGTHATKMNFTAVLNAGQEIPHPAGPMAGASGKFTASVSGTKITWKLTFNHLTGAASAAHIHAGKKGVAGAVIVPLCGPCKTGASGTGTLTSAQLTAMKAGTTYVNVHTAKNPNGEIRGQVKMTM